MIQLFKSGFVFVGWYSVPWFLLPSFNLGILWWLSKKDIYIKQCDTYILLIPNTYMNNIHKCNQILKRKCLWRMWYLRKFSIVFYRWIGAFCRTLKPVWHLLLTEKAIGHWSYILRKVTSTLCSVSNHKGSRNPEGSSSVSDWEVFK